LRKKDLGPKGRTEREQYLWQIAAVAFLAMMGDMYAQIFEGTRYSEYDFGRTARFTLFRAVVAAPVYIYWLSKLDALAEQLSALTGMWPLLIKLLLDQGVYTPVYQVVFFCFLAALEGQPLSEGFRRCLLVLPQSIPVAWCFWLPVQAVCFHIVPLQWRVVYVNVFNIVWNTILSLFNSSASAAPVASMPAEPIETASDLVSMASSVAAASRSASLAAAAAGAAAGDIAGVEASAEDGGDIYDKLPRRGGGRGARGGGDDADEEMLAWRARKRAAAAGHAAASAAAHGLGDGTCADNWPKQCKRKVNKCYSEWVLARCPWTCGLCQ